MTNPVAAAILTAVTDGKSGWYTFDNTMNDATGTNNITGNLTVAGYSPGIQGAQLNQGSQGTVELAEPLTITTTSGEFTIAGWFDYDGIETNPYIMGLVRHLGPATQEVLTLANFPLGHFSVTGWEDDGINTYIVTDPNVRATAYPMTFQVQDSTGRFARSNQLVRITEAGDNPAGRYFVGATYSAGMLTLFVDTVNVNSAVVTQIFTPTIAYFQVGALGFGLSACGLDECFFLGNKALNAAEWAYLYNDGAGVSYATLEADGS